MLSFITGPNPSGFLSAAPKLTTICLSLAEALRVVGSKYWTRQKRSLSIIMRSFQGGFRVGFNVFMIYYEV